MLVNVPFIIPLLQFSVLQALTLQTKFNPIVSQSAHCFQKGHSTPRQQHVNRSAMLSYSCAVSLEFAKV